jgi:hypothetical protein
MHKHICLATFVLASLGSTNISAKTLADTMTDTLTFTSMSGPADLCPTWPSFTQDDSIVIDTTAGTVEFGKLPNATAHYRNILDTIRQDSTVWHDQFLGAVTVTDAYLPELSDSVTKIYGSFSGTVNTTRTAKEITGKITFKGIATPGGGVDPFTCYMSFAYSAALSNPLTPFAESEEGSSLSVLKGYIRTKVLDSSSTGTTRKTRTAAVGVRG